MLIYLSSSICHSAICLCLSLNWSPCLTSCIFFQPLSLFAYRFPICHFYHLSLPVFVPITGYFPAYLYSFAGPASASVHIPHWTHSLFCLFGFAVHFSIVSTTFCLSDHSSISVSYLVLTDHIWFRCVNSMHTQLFTTFVISLCK